MTTIATASSYGKPVNSDAFYAALAHDASPNAPKRFSLLDGDTSFFTRIKVPKISDVTFEVDGIPLHAHNMPDNPNDKVVIWGVLGYLPFSIVSREKRHALIQIIESSHTLPIVRLGVDAQMQIVVTGTYPVQGPPTPNYIFEPVIHFIQEARPFIRLIAEQL